MRIPRIEAEYLAAVVDRLRGHLGDTLVGVYPNGSLALDGYRPGRSDLDVVAVAERPSPARIAAVVAALDHGTLPCPATGLEFVLYDRATLATLTTGAGFALNLNTGRELPAKVEEAPAWVGGAEAGQHDPRFWYPIDRDILHQHGQVLTGPAFGDLAPRLPHADLVPVVAESVATYLADIAAHGDNAVLNGCRGLRFHTERHWSAKPAAARWALDHAPGFAPLITAAIDSHRRDRAAGRAVDTGRAADFLRLVLRRLRGRAG